MRIVKVLIGISLVGLALLLFTGNPTYAATVNAPATITADTIWTSDNVYVVQNSTTVQLGVLLTIQPGTVVKFNSSAYLLVKGTLQASGTSDQNIIFTSYKDDTYGGDTNGDGTATTPAKGNWKYIGSYTGATVTCSYCQIKYGGNTYSMVYSTGGDLYVDHCLIDMSNTRGIEIKGTASITDNQISNFTTTGIYVNSGSPVISGNTTTGGNYGVIVNSGNPSISNNYLTGSIYGVSVSEGNPTITSNTFNNISDTAIYIKNGNVGIIGNILSGGALTDNKGIVVEKGTINIQDNNIFQFPGCEAILLGKLYGSGTSISGNVSGNTISACKYPLGFAGDKISAVTFNSNDTSGCSLQGMNLHVTLASQAIPVYDLAYILSYFTVKSGATVQIVPGTVFKMSGSAVYLLSGTLIAEGTEENPVVFTSLKDDQYGGDTNNNGTASTAQPGDWGYFLPSDNSTIYLSHVVFKYGTEALSATQPITSLDIENCDISRMSDHGIYISSNNTATIRSNRIHHNGQGIRAYIASPIIENNEIYSNGRGIYISGSSSSAIVGNNIYNNSYGVYLMMDSSDQNNCLIENNNIQGNTSYGLYTWTANNPPVTTAENNWWGSATGPNPLGSGDKINSTTKIDVTPWLTGEYVPPAPLDDVRSYCLHYDPETRIWSLVLEPVDAGTGAHMINKELISIAGVRSLGFELSYNSLMLNEGPMGKGWGHNYEARLESQTDGSVKLCWTSNRENTFTSSDQTNYTCTDQACRLDTLVKNTDGTYTLTRNDQSQYLFNVSGQLVEQRNPFGQPLTMTYSSQGQLAAITEPVSGQALALAYNTEGLVQTITDNANRQISFQYDLGHNLVGITDPAGKTTAFTYDSLGQVLTETDGEGEVAFSNTYDQQGRVIAQDDGISTNLVSTLTYDDTTQPGTIRTTITDRVGNSKTYVHDENYQLIEVIDELGNSTQYTYDEYGNRTSETDAMNQTTATTYDDRNNPLTVTDALGNVTTMTYDSRNNLLTLQNADNQVTSYAYDSNNRVTAITDALNNQTIMTYDTNGQLLTTTLPRDGQISYTYQNGLPQTITDPAGNTSTYGYDSVGRVTSITNAAGKTSQLAYDVYDNITALTDPLGNQVSYLYDSRGKLVTFTDARNNQTSYTYDANLNLTSVTDPLNHVTQYSYDGEGRLTGITDPRGNSTTYSYDAKGRLISTTDALGNTQTRSYDTVDNLVTITDPLSESITTTYDGLHNPLTVTDALDNTTVFSYDSLSRLDSSTDPLNRATHYHYDALNRMIQTGDPAQGQAKQEFDNDGNRDALVDPNNNRLEFEFNQAGQLTAENADSRSLSYTYNSLGLLATFTNGRSQVSTFQYDDAGRLITRIDPEGTTSYTYDANGNVLTITNSMGTITRTYDELNRVTSYTDVNSNTISYGYDENGNLTTLTYPDNKQVAYQYDELNRLTSVTDWAQRTTTYAYDEKSRLISTTRPDGSQETRNYDAVDRITQIKDTLPDATILNQFDFTYDAANNIAVEDSTTAHQPYVPDAVALTYTTDNRLATYNGDLISYDADGNMAIGPLDGTTVNYSYDSRNRLTSAGSLSYQYDAEDHRISLQDTGSGSTTYIINPSTLSQVLVSTDPQGNETYYVYGLGLIGQENPDGSYQSYHYDLRGSTAALTNQLGQVTDTFEYGPYGEFSTRTGTTQTPFLYNGRDGVMTDSNGLYYMRARYYNPEIKRFINQDILLGEITDSQSLNRYAYVNGEPISSIDPFGLSTWSDIKAIPGTISEGVTGGVRVVKEETIPYLKSDEAKTAYKQTAAAVAVAQINIAVQGAGAARFGRCAATGPSKIDPNKLNHIFGNPAHNLGTLLSRFGGDQSKAYMALEKTTQQYVSKHNITGNFKDIVVKVDNVKITVRGTVIEGKVKIGTAFIP